jgi:hypothetical protein
MDREYSMGMAMREKYMEAADSMRAAPMDPTGTVITVDAVCVT